LAAPAEFSSSRAALAFDSHGPSSPRIRIAPSRGVGVGILPCWRRAYSGTVPLRLNRFLFDPCEIDSNEDDIASLGVGDEGPPPHPTVTLRKDDYRTVHAAKVLGLQNGDRLRAGVVGEAGGCNNEDGVEGLVTDEATVQWMPEGKIKKAEPTRNGEPPGSLKITLNSLVPPPDDAASSSALSVSLILALPRPLQLGRLLPMIAQMGVDHLVLTGAKKVPKDYFGSHFFRKPNELRRCLVEGLCQAGDVRLPKVTVVRSLKQFLEDDADALFPPGESSRAFAHPQRMGQPALPRLRDVAFPHGSDPKLPKMVLAVGPEGGWEEDYEIDMLKKHGFQQVTLGTRVLRSDVAVVSLLGLAHDACAARAATDTNIGECESTTVNPI